MKKYSFILWAALAMASVFTACTDNDSPMTEQNEARTATIHATIDGDLGSRVALEDDVENQKVKVDWAEGDAFKINVNEKDYTFVYNTNTGEFEYDTNQSGTFPETFTNAGTVTATYPATTPTGYANQPGTLDGAAALLTMTATLDVESGESTGNLALNFKHENSIVKMTLSNDAFKGKNVTGVALKSGSTAVATATSTFTGDADNGSIVAYFAVEPQAVTNISIVTVCEGSCYAETLSDKTLESGNLYNVSKGMTKVTGSVAAANAKKGDFALLDGTFISKEAATLTNEEKACVAGIVFWTVNDEGSSTLVGDAADKIMQTDFPYCTHGLIVALTNVHEDCAWQNSGSNESVYTNFQDTENFNPSNKSDYKSIASEYNGTDNINFILGYQNTKVLEAYNEYCLETSGKDSYTVNPVSRLATWKDSNPAPANTTGWFIPSVKELHMLCHKDDSYNKYSTATRDAIDPLIEALGGKKLSDYYYYWSSSEEAGYDDGAFAVDFRSGRVVICYKDNIDYVRAVCAY